MNMIIHAQSLHINLPVASAVPLDLSGLDTLTPAFTDIRDVELSTPPVRLPGVEWVEEGGILLGIMPAEDKHPAYYLIAAPETLASECAWGDAGTSVNELSKWDGFGNTQWLIARKGKHPAAAACAEYKNGGRSDYYLMSSREAHLAAATCPHLFKDSWYWTSTQSSAYYAFAQHFGYGHQIYISKYDKCWVRPIRRVLIH